MCATNSCGCGSSESSGSLLVVAAGLGVAALVSAAVSGGWLVLLAAVAVTVAVVVFTRGMALLFAAVCLWRWFTGARMYRGRFAPATFLRAAPPPARPSLRFGVRVNWRYWPGWQRAVVRWVLTGLAAAGLWQPLLTGAVTGAAVASLVGAAAVSRHQVRMRERALRVPAAVAANPPVRRGISTTAIDGQVWDVPSRARAAS